MKKFPLWLKLDIAWLAVFIVFFKVLLINSLADPDYFWHLEVGEYIAKQGVLPPHEIFSHTRPGAEWVLQEWLFQTLLYWIHWWTGEIGVRVLCAFMLAATFGHILYTSRKFTNQPWLVYGILLAAYFLTTPLHAPRAQLFSLFFTTFFLHVMLMYKYQKQKPSLWLMPIVMLFWVNLHGGFMLGIAIFLAFCITEHIQTAYQQRSWTFISASQKHLWIVFLLIVLASLFNPDHVHRLLFPFQVFEMSFSNTVIFEWNSPNFHLLLFKVYFLAIALWAISYFYSQKRPDLTELIIPGCFVYASLVTQRYMPFATVAILFFILPHLKHFPDSLVAQKLRLALQKGGGKDIGNIEYVINWMIVCAGVIYCVQQYPIEVKKHSSFVNETYPVAASNFISSNKITGNLWNEYNYGGYLIRHLYPDNKVFIDGRSDAYGEEFMKEMVLLSSAPADWESRFNKYKIDVVLINKDHPLRHLLLLKNNYDLAYEDKAFSVLLKRNGPYQPLIDQYHTAKLAPL